MSPAVTRRRLVQASAAALGATVAGVPASAVTSIPDAELLRLLDSYPAAATAMRLAGDRCEALWEALSVEEPDRPDALHIQHDDGFGLDCDTYRLPDGRQVRVYGLDGIDKLRAMPLPRRSEWKGEPAPWDPREQVGRFISVPDERRIARRAEILASFDIWWASCEAIKDRLCIPAADDADDEATKAVWGLDAAILASAPTTLAGLAAKARWVARYKRKSVSATDWQKRIVDDVIALAEREGAAR